MCMDSNYKHLFAADNFGYLYHWDIEDYATEQEETEPPECMLWF